MRRCRGAAEPCRLKFFHKRFDIAVRGKKTLLVHGRLYAFVFRAFDIQPQDLSKQHRRPIGQAFVRLRKMQIRARRFDRRADLFVSCQTFFLGFRRADLCRDLVHATLGGCEFRGQCGRIGCEPVLLGSEAREVLSGPLHGLFGRLSHIVPPRQRARNSFLCFEPAVFAQAFAMNFTLAEMCFQRGKLLSFGCLFRQQFSALIPQSFEFLAEGRALFLH